MLTKKDFKTVAEIVYDWLPLPNQFYKAYSADELARENLMFLSKLTAYFAAQNPRFDRERFMKACGLSPW
ncbi:hypothetical protein KAR91_78685 [Candidatus Pacearchaeota archaeon]|nr:hypothetical protein [Candidatus Pacearchaeota archaeon]